MFVNQLKELEVISETFLIHFLITLHQLQTVLYVQLILSICKGKLIISKNM